jgi:hypothetical protein
MGHIGYPALVKIVESTNDTGLTMAQLKEWHAYNKEHPCGVCVMAKHKEQPHLPRDSAFSQTPMYRLHVDILTMPVLADDRYKYALVVVDEATNYVTTIPTVNKAACTAELIAYMKRMEPQLGPYGSASREAVAPEAGHSKG